MANLPSMRSDRSEVLPYNFKSYPAFIGLEKLSDHPNNTMLNHWHEELEIILPVSGRMVYSINGTPVHIDEGTGIFVNSQQIHYGYSADGSDCEYIYAMWHPILLCATGSIEKHFVKPVIESADVPYIRLDGATPWKAEIMQIARGLLDNSGSAHNIPMMQSLIYKAWQLIYENTTEARKTSSSVNIKLSLLKQMLSFIHQNFGEKIYLNEIANAANVSVSTCASIFKQYFQVSPIKYLNTYRLQISCDMLKDTERSITEIAMEAGFASVSYYIESFRKEYGLTPLEYRAKHKPRISEFELDF